MVRDKYLGFEDWTSHVNRLKIEFSHIIWNDCGNYNQSEQILHLHVLGGLIHFVFHKWFYT